MVDKSRGNDSIKNLRGYAELLKYSNVKHIIGDEFSDIELNDEAASDPGREAEQNESVAVAGGGSASSEYPSPSAENRSTVQMPSAPEFQETQEEILPGSLELFSLSDEAAGYKGLSDLREAAMKCTKCVLANGRTNVVFGEGDPNARLMFIGEGPGEQEDIKGRPFVGRAGQLLDKMIAAMGYKREEVYIANIVKCRPPQNRAPLPDEAISCLPYLRAQISFIKPKIIVPLGAVAVKFLLQTNAGISQVRGKFLDYHGYKVLPTFHPAFLLRSPGKKKEAWEDLKKVMAFLEES